MTKYPDELLAMADSFADEPPTTPELEEFFKPEEILKVFVDSAVGDNMDGYNMEIIDDPTERLDKARKFCAEHNAQAYTEVDGDDGHIYYSKGFRFCNTINQGLYTIVKRSGCEVDNS